MFKNQQQTRTKKTNNKNNAITNNNKTTITAITNINNNEIKQIADYYWIESKCYTILLLRGNVNLLLDFSLHVLLSVKDRISLLPLVKDGHLNFFEILKLLWKFFLSVPVYEAILLGMVGHCATFLDLPLFSIPPLNEWIFIGEICQS